MQKITTFLWFDTQAEAAATLYTSLFKNSKIVDVTRLADGRAETFGKPEGSAMTVTFELDGQTFIALNGGPGIPFTEAISLLTHCEGQDEVDYLWERLSSDGGQEGQCGWLKDKYGVSWQIVPTELVRLISDPNRARAGRVMQAMLQMKKIDIESLRRAAAEHE